MAGWLCGKQRRVSSAQVSELMEVLVVLGHEGDAATLQSALDAQVKGFIAAADDIQAHPIPPESASQAAKTTAERNAADLQSRLHSLQKAAWKWELLRPA